MQGIQVLTGADDAWGGFASKYAERLRDEFGKMSIWMWGFGEEQGKGPGAKQALRMFNTAQVVAEVSTNATMYVPVYVPTAPLPEYLQLDRNSQWHVSALLSAAFETMTLPTRLRSGERRRQLDNIKSALDVNGNQRVAQLQCSLVNPNGTIGKLGLHRERNATVAPGLSRPLIQEDEVQDLNVDLDVDLSANQMKSERLGFLTSSNHVFGGFECLRGKTCDDNGELHEEDDDEVELSKKRSRFAGVPVIERLASR